MQSIYDQPKNESPPQGEMSSHEASFGLFSVVCILGYMWFSKNEARIDRWFYLNFENLWLAGLTIAGLGICFLVYKLTRRNIHIFERMRDILPFSPGDIHVGYTPDYMPIGITENLRSQHVQIIGSTGRGKTHSVIMPWSLRDLVRRRNVIVIDGKGASDLANNYNKHRVRLNYKVLHFSLDNPDSSIAINPLRNGTPQEITDRLFAAFDFEESKYHKNMQMDRCLFACRLLHATGEIVTFAKIRGLLINETRLLDLVSRAPEFEDEAREFLAIPAPKRKEQMSGLISQLTPFAKGELACILNADFEQPDYMGRALGLSQSKKGKKPVLLLFSLPSLAYQQMASKLGKMILQDIGYGISQREKFGQKEFLPVFLDEFSSFIYPEFVNILNKARSSGVGLHLSHQSLGDFNDVSYGFAQSISTNTNVKCILGVNDPDTAEVFARHMGTVPQTKFTRKVEQTGFFKDFEDTGLASSRETEIYRIHPNTLKNLNVGQGVLHFPSEINGNFSEIVNFQPFSVSELEMPEEEPTTLWEVLIGY